MSTTPEILQGLLTAFQKAPASRVVTDIAAQLQQAITTYARVGVSSAPPDLVGWTANYQAAFTAADLASRWAYGAATLTPTLGPSPSSPAAFDTTSGTFNTLVANCEAAAAAALAPTNGEPPLVDVAAAVDAALLALRNTWGSGPPSVSAPAAAYFASTIWLASAVAGQLGISWTPA